MRVPIHSTWTGNDGYATSGTGRDRTKKDGLVGATLAQ